MGNRREEQAGMLGVAGPRDQLAVPRRRGEFTRAGGAIHYEVTGTGPALIFAHGLGGNHMSWWQQVPAFADRFTCVTFAHRGFFPSRDAADPLGPDAFADDLLGLMDHLGLADAALVAQSMGGWACLEAAIRAPSRVRALVMASTSGTIDHRLAAAGLGDWPERSSREREALAALGVHVALGARAAREQPALHLLYRHIDEAARIPDKEVLRRRLYAARRRGPEALDGLPMPILFLAGAEDIVFPPQVAMALGERIGRPAAILGKTGHSAYFERPEAFNALVAGFLGSP